MDGATTSRSASAVKMRVLLVASLLVWAHGVRDVTVFPTTLVFGSPFLLPLSTPDSIVGKLVFPRGSATRIRVIVVVIVIIIVVRTPPPQVF